MTEDFSSKQQAAIRAYYAQREGPRVGENAKGEPLGQFDIFADPPRTGARDTIERYMTDLPKSIQMQMELERTRGPRTGVDVIVVSLK